MNGSGSGVVNGNTLWGSGVTAGTLINLLGSTYNTVQGNAFDNASVGVSFDSSSHDNNSADLNQSNPSTVTTPISDAGTNNRLAAVNLKGGALGSVPYQTAANTTGFLASPTTTGHVFAETWQPTGSAIAPTALDLNT